ncbi:MAG: peptidylprolyl isomerase [Hyphomicrobiales bacterium]
MVAVSLQGCSIKPAIPLKPKKISVNGVRIARETIARETQNHPAAKPIEAWLAAARALVVRELLLQEATRLGVVPVPTSDTEGRRETDEEAMIRQLVEREIIVPEASDDECRRYYDNNRQRFRTAPLYEARHILFPADPSDAPARSVAGDRAEAAIAELMADPARFAALAEAISACPSGKVGGSLGQVGPAQTVPEFEQALELAPIGQIMPTPVETRYGVHVVLVERRIDGVTMPFEAVRPTIAAWLAERVRRTATRQYIAVLAGKAEITGIDLAQAPTPLVQ